jgi:hypothetical protein
MQFQFSKSALQNDQLLPPRLKKQGGPQAAPSARHRRIKMASIEPVDAINVPNVS